MIPGLQDPSVSAITLDDPSMFADWSGLSGAVLPSTHIERESFAMKVERAVLKPIDIEKQAVSGEVIPSTESRTPYQK